MAINVRSVVRKLQQVVYDGSNGPEIVELFEGTSANNDGQTLPFLHPNGELCRVNQGDHILFIDNRGINDGWCDWQATVPDETFNRQYSNDPEARVSVLETEVAALKSQPVRELP